MLRRGLDEDLPVLVDAGQRRVGLQVEVLLPGELEFAFEDVRATREGGLRFAAAQHGPRTLVALRGDGLLDRDQRRQRLVFDGDLGGPDPGRLEGVGEHPAHRVPVVHDLAGEQRLVMLDPRVVHPWHVGSGEHVDHPWHGQRWRGVHRAHLGVRVRGLHRVGVQHAWVAADQVVCVEGKPGDVQVGALVRHLDADHRARRAGAEFTHDVTPSGTADSAWNLSSDCSSIAARKAALALWSSIGVPSRPSTAAASRTVSAVHGRPRSASSVAVARSGVAATPPRPMVDSLDDTVDDVHGECDCDAGDVVEPPLGDLVEGGHRGRRHRDAHRPDQLGRLLHTLPVASEVVGQRDLAFAARPCQHDRCLQGQQRGRGVPDGGGGAEVAAQRGAVADQPGRELRPELIQQRDPPVQQPFGLGQGERGADLDLG